MKGSAPSMVAWTVWTLTVALFGAMFYLGFNSERDAAELQNELPVLVAVSIFVLAYATVGALVVSKMPRNAVGWLAAGAGFFYSMAAAFLTYSGQGELAELRPGGELALVLSQWGWLVGLTLGGPLLVLFFPNGRLPGPRWKLPLLLIAAGLALFVLSVTFAPGVIEDTDVQNPIGIPGAGAALGVASSIGGTMVLAGSLASFVSVFVRFRRASAHERDQVKWFLFAVGTAVAFGLGAGLPLEAIGAYELSNFVITAGLSVVPISIGVAVLRRRLYDIDVVINRTLVYGALTGILAGAYIGLVFAFQAAMGPITAESDLAIAASTLAVAALVRPLRSRIQAFIDRRFYRRKFDAQRTLDGFVSHLRDEVDLPALSSRLTGVVAETMQPAHVSLWLRTR